MNAPQLSRKQPSENALAGPGDITYRLATSQSELEQAFELVWKAYVRVGLEKEGRQGIRLTKYHLLPDTKVFIAVTQNGRQAGKVIGTLSIIPDSVMELPAAKVARKELVQLRREGKRAAECVALACDEEGTRQRVILKLFRLALEYSRRNGYSTMLASLTERHIGFYRRFLDFQPLGGLKPYEMGNGTPVQAHCIHLTTPSNIIEARSAALERDPDWRNFWHSDASDVLSAAAPPRPWKKELIRHFVRRSNCFAKQLDVSTIQALNSEYSRYGWEFAC